MRLWLAFLAVLLAQAQQGPSPEVSLLGRIKGKVAENLRHLPNYTCTQTIIRSLRRKPAARLQRLDTVRLEVAYVGGKELYGWPGSGRIDQSQITKLVTGTIGNGDFAVLPSSIFLGESARFQYNGASTLDGKPAIRYDYAVPQIASGYQIQAGAAAAIVGYHGSFWVDPETLDLIRLDASADDIPNRLKPGFRSRPHGIRPCFHRKLAISPSTRRRVGYQGFVRSGKPESRAPAGLP